MSDNLVIINLDCPLMPIFPLIFVAVIQGLTEFLPVSSSAHLILVSELTERRDQDLLIDVSVHVGTLFAVVIYFWSDVRMAIAGSGRLCLGRVDSSDAFFALCLLIATLPVLIAGAVLLWTGWIYHLRSIVVIGWAMIVFGVILYGTDQIGGQERTVSRWRLNHAVVMGLWQSVALVPGASRSGVVISAARYLGYDRVAAARLAMLMSIPAIIASGAAVLWQAVVQGDIAAVGYGVVAAMFAFFAALVSITIMMRVLRRFSYTPFVAYRVLLGIVLLIIGYGSSGTNILG